MEGNSPPLPGRRGGTRGGRLISSGSTAAPNGSAWEIRPWYVASGEAGGIIIFSEDITQRRRTEEALRRSNNELDLSIHALREKTENMEEVNAALKVLLRQREEDRKELVESVLANVRNLILPYVEKLNQSDLNSAPNDLDEDSGVPHKRDHFFIRQNTCRSICQSHLYRNSDRCPHKRRQINCPDSRDLRHLGKNRLPPQGQHPEKTGITGQRNQP